jgi:hypothetical protein
MSTAAFAAGFAFAFLHGEDGDDLVRLLAVSEGVQREAELLGAFGVVGDDHDVAEVAPAQARQSGRPVLLVLSAPVGIAIALEEAEAFHGVGAVHQDAVGPVGVEDEDRRHEGDGHEDRSPDEEGDHGERNQCREGLEDALDDGALADVNLGERVLEGALEGPGCLAVMVAASATAEGRVGRVTTARSVETEEDWDDGLTSMPSGVPAKAPAMGSGRSGSIAFLPLFSWSGVSVDRAIK